MQENTRPPAVSVLDILNRLIDRLEVAKGSARLGCPDELVDRIKQGGFDEVHKGGVARALLCMCDFLEAPQERHD